MPPDHYELTYHHPSTTIHPYYTVKRLINAAAIRHDIDVKIGQFGYIETDDTIETRVLVQTTDEFDPEDTFWAADHASQIDAEDGFTTDTEPAPDPNLERALRSFLASDDATTTITHLNQDPDTKIFRYGDLTPCDPSTRDLWFVKVVDTTRDASDDIDIATIADFYQRHASLYRTHPSLKLGIEHQQSDETFELTVLATLTDRQEARQLAAKAGQDIIINYARKHIIPVTIDQTTPEDVTQVLNNA